MDPIWLLLLLPCAAAGGWIMANRDQRRRSVAARPLPSAYFKGLNFLLNEQPDKALRVFIEVVEVDSDTMEMHLALGNLFRRRGEIERATHIHQNLATRTDIDDELRGLAVFELAQDYFKAGLFDRAEKLFHELRQSPEHHEQANRFLLQIYDQEKEWSRALIIADELAKKFGVELAKPRAQYCCELAEKAIGSGQNELAARHIKSAFNYHPNCVRAVIQSGRLASMRGDHSTAITIWRRLEKWAPEALGEVVVHVANSYSALNDAANYRRFLQNALKYSSDSRIIGALVELAERDQPGAAQTLLPELVRNYPSMDGLCELVNARATNGRTAREKKDFALLAELLSELLGRARGYHCTTCGFAGSALHWQCPGCKSWGTVQKRLAIKLNRPAQLAARSV